MSRLPNGWGETTLGFLLEFKYGKALPDRIRSGCGFSVYGSNGVVGKHREPLTSGETIIVGRKGSVGVVSYCSDPCSPIDTTYYVDNFNAMPARFWLHYLQSLNLKDLNKSTAIPGLSREDAYKLILSIPPLNEQKRIVDKLDVLLKRVDACREKLDRVPLILKRFRQAVLAAATSGNLTEAWREQNGVSSEWPCFEVGDIAFVTKLAGFEYTKYVSYREGGDLKVIKAENADKRGFKYTEFSTVYSEEVSALTRTILKANDVLMVFVGAGTGQVARVPAGDWFLGPNIAMIRTDHTLLNSAYLEHYCRSPIGRDEISKFIKSVAQPSLSMKTIRRIKIALPKLDEQNEIVHQVDKLFAFADSLEARYLTARKQVDQLTPSLLAKAFRGELVEQDPNDEPASVLLERIKAERAKSAATRPSAPVRSGRKAKPSKPEPPPSASEPPKPKAAETHIPHRILAAMLPGREYARAEITAASGVTDIEWSWAIKQLKAEGKVRQTGERRGARYSRI